MIKTLKAACEKQNNHEPFGQADLDGSFLALLQRGFIDCKNSTRHGRQEVFWFVTEGGINALRKLNINDRC